MERSKRRHLDIIHKKRDIFSTTRRDTVDGRRIADLKLDSLDNPREERDSDYQEIPYVDIWEGLTIQ